LNEFASVGLRTLLIASKEIPANVYSDWSSRYQKATTEVHNKKKKLDALADEIEQNFELIGSTAIEDKLQEDVGDTIKSIKQAGI
jgi:phospholipid-transporting ATPase